VARRDPLANTPELIRRIYSYVAYRVGEGPDAEDVTSEVFERALRYRKSYDPSRGEPLAWLIGIARRCLDDARTTRGAESRDQLDVSSPEDLEADALQRLSVAAAVDGLDERSRDLVALRYGADLSARQIGEILGMKTNAVEVALHRTLARLRPVLEDTRPTATGAAPAAPPASEQSEKASGWA
jgi:RNA polymerase sigma-70 factor (ECF subfamily)